MGRNPVSSYVCGYATYIVIDDNTTGPMMTGVWEYRYNDLIGTISGWTSIGTFPPPSIIFEETYVGPRDVKCTVGYDIPYPNQDIISNFSVSDPEYEHMEEGTYIDNSYNSANGNMMVQCTFDIYNGPNSSGIDGNTVFADQTAAGVKVYERIQRPSVGFDSGWDPGAAFEFYIDYAIEDVKVIGDGRPEFLGASIGGTFDDFYQTNKCSIKTLNGDSISYTYP
jgi:hypothetical protein